MHNKHISEINSLEKENINLLVADEHKPNLAIRDRVFTRCLLLRLGLKKANFDKITFHQCIFQDCYFRETKFHNVDFTGSTFRDCNFERATFQSCRFRYVTFSRCLLDYSEIMQSLPSEPNIAILLLKSLQRNAREIGNRNFADKLLSQQIDVEKRDLKNRIWAVSKYYKDRYEGLDRWLSLAQFIKLVLSGWFWGHGMRLKSLFRSALILLLLFTSLFYFFGAFLHQGQPSQLSIWMSFYISIATFTTLGYSSHIPASGFTYVLHATESLTGVLFLGFLAASLYRKFAR